MFHIEPRDPQAEEAAAPAPRGVGRPPALAEALTQVVTNSTLSRHPADQSGN